MRLVVWLSALSVSAASAALFVACSSASEVVIPGGDGSTNAGQDGNVVSSNDGGNFGDGNPNNENDGGASDGSIVATDGCAPNPANSEIPGNGCDDDDDGTVDILPTCDTAIADGGATGFANAIGICDVAATRGFGIVSATYTRGYNVTDAPQDGQHEILPKFGSTILPREGTMLGALSSGFAFEFDDGTNSGTAFNNGLTQDWYGYGSADQGAPGNGTAPPGYPKAAKNCAQETVVNDLIDVKLTLKAPPNAKGISFDENFWSSDFPTYVCSRYNDAFIAYLSAAGFNGGTPDNIAFDPAGNPIAVNASFLNRCTTNSPAQCDPDGDGGPPVITACSAGTGELNGTGFAAPGVYCESQPDGGGDGGDAGIEQSGGGATGWLTTVAPVNEGEIFTIEFMIWDAADATFDSSVLLDHFHWLGTTPVTSTTRAK